jgi:cellulose 1,4-beta-cellobiosidase
LVAAPGNGQVSLSWNADPPATAYYVKRATNSAGAYSIITSVSGPTVFTDAPLANGTTYYYVVSGVNSLGESSNSMPAGAMPAPPPTIIAQPRSQAANQGDPATFSVTATSLVSMTFQWQFNGNTLAGATTNAYTIASVQPTNAGQYTVLVSNYGGSVASLPALLTVRPFLALTPGGVLTWSGAYKLQSASNVPGPYMEISGATSPYTNDLSLPQQFFRLSN